MDVNGRTGGTNLIEKLSTAATAILDVGVELFVGRAAYTFFDVQIYWGLSTPDTSTIHSIDRTMFQLQVRRRLVTYPVYFVRHNRRNQAMWRNSVLGVFEVFARTRAKLGCPR